MINPEHKSASTSEQTMEKEATTLALVWMAQNPCLRSAPAGTLERVREKLALSAPSAEIQSSNTTRTHHLYPHLGWAAALLISASWWLTEHKSPQQGIGQTTKKLPGNTSRSTEPPTQKTSTAAPASPPLTLTPASPEMIKAHLDAQHEQAGKNPSSAPGVYRPLIVELTPPGKTPAAHSQARMLDLIATALERQMLTTAPVNEREVVIESGWASLDLASADPSLNIRHRNFPLEQAHELQLLINLQGDYYDPKTQFLWKATPVSGEYIGTKKSSAEVTGDFHPAPASTISPLTADTSETSTEKKSPSTSSSSAQAEPQGALVSLDDSSIVILNNVPEPKADEKLILNVQGEQGQNTAFLLDQAIAGQATVSFVIPQHATNINSLVITPNSLNNTIARGTIILHGPMTSGTTN
jgi:hypothetical protein